MLARQLIEDQRLGLGGLQQPGHLGRGRLQAVDHLGQPLVGLGQAGGLEDPTDGRGDHGRLGLADMAQHVT
jgi:hypothetical protein